MPVEQGSYLLRLTLPTDRPLGLLPRRWLEPLPVPVEAEDVIKDIHVRRYEDEQQSTGCRRRA
jgi:hypothetical protein